MFGTLSSEDEERVELRLLSDAEYSTEFAILENELIDEYSDDSLSKEDRILFEGHFLKSGKRKAKLEFAAALNEAARDPARVRPRPLPISTYWKMAAAIVIVVGLGSVSLFLYVRRSNHESSLADLNAAYKKQRLIESRVTKLDYAPLVIIRGKEKPDIDEISLRRAELQLLKDVGEHPDAESHHALGRFYLAGRQFDKAIEQFQISIRLDPKDARIQSDMGVALLEIGKLHSSEKAEGQNVEEFAKSLEHFNAALALNGSLLEALFNRALLYQQMALLPQAEADWHAYLEKDSQSQWADEARRNLKRTQEQRQKTSQAPTEILQEFLTAFESQREDIAWKLVSSNHNRSGNVIVEQLLDGYLDGLSKKSKSVTGHNLKALSYVGEIEKQRSGDLFFSQLAQYYQSVTAEQQAQLVEARGLVKAGHEGWGRSRVEESYELFSRAKQIYDKAGDICESDVTDYWLSFCSFRQRQKEQTLSILNPLISTCESKGFKHLLTRSLYLRSITQFDILNELSKAIDSAERSLVLAEQMNDTVGALNALSSLIEYFRHLGNYERALSYIERSLPWVNLTSMDPIQGSRHYGLVANAFASANLYAAAADYQKEALRFALSTGNPTVMAQNYVFLGIIDGNLKNYDDALKYLQLAYETAEGHSNEASDRGLMAYASLQLGHIYRLRENFELALTYYTNALNLYEGIDQPTDLYLARKGRVLCYLALKNDQLAQEELSRALNLIETYRSLIVEEDNRENFFDAEQSLYDVAIDFAYSRENDSNKALQLSESSRARSLLDLVNSDEVYGDRKSLSLSVSEPLSREEIQKQLPEEAQILQYAVLENRLIIWSITKQGISTKSRDINQNDLNKLVVDYLNSISLPPANNREEEMNRGKALYDILIKPVEDLLVKNKQICLVPDKILNYLPFSALISTSSGKYLLEEYVFVDSPSSTLFVRCSELAREKRSIKDERLLAVGNPSFDRGRFPSLPDLPSAAEEAREVSGYYGSARTLIGTEARAEAVKREMPNANVMHLALHSVFDSEFPLRSKLLMATDDSLNGSERDTALHAYEIYGMRMPSARLVILSACQTGAERYYKGEGMISLTRAFLAARVPLVVSSLWPVDSDATVELMVGFHKYRKTQGQPTAAALRNSQLDMLHGTDERLHHPYFWAPFVVTGGYANF